jgi:hypothetical protein
MMKMIRRDTQGTRATLPRSCSSTSKLSQGMLQAVVGGMVRLVSGLLDMLNKHRRVVSIVPAGADVWVNDNVDKDMYH